MVTAEGGERFAFSAMVPWVALEASFIAHTAAYLCVLGLAGLGWQSIFGTFGSGRVAKRCCVLVVHNGRVGRSVRFVLGKVAGVLRSNLSVRKRLWDSWVCGCPVGFRAPDFPGFPRLLALALAPGGSAAFFCMPRY
jgi:hypothetical protein